MRRSILTLAAALALGGGALAFSGGAFALGGSAALAQANGSPPAPAASASAVPAASASAAASPAAAAPAIVHIKNFAYVPATLTIHPGQAVRFVEDDETAHTVTASDRSYDSGNLDKGQSWTHTYATAGTYTYFCIYHPYMTASITVK